MEHENTQTVAVAAGETVEMLPLPERGKTMMGRTLDGYTADQMEDYARAHAAREVAAALEGQTQAYARLAEAAQKIVMYKHCMSYNDSYFGESEGYLKRAVYEIDRVISAAPQQQAQAVAVDERAAFEAWARKECGFDGEALQREPHGRYLWGRTSDMWAAFRAALATPAAPGSGAGAAGCDCDDGMVWNEGCTQPCEKCQDITDDSADEGQAGAAPAQAVDTEVLLSLVDSMCGAHSAAIDVAHCPSSEPFRTRQRKFYAKANALRKVVELIAAPIPQEGADAVDAARQIPAGYRLVKLQQRAYQTSRGAVYGGSRVDGVVPLYSIEDENE